MLLIEGQLLLLETEKTIFGNIMIRFWFMIQNYLLLNISWGL